MHQLPDFIKWLVRALALSLLPALAAAIEVVEGQPAVVTDAEGAYSAQPAPATAVNDVSARSYNTAAPADSGAAALYVQLQTLQAEVGQLRGLVEEQAYLIEQLSQRRMDDYLDLDRRIGELHQQITGQAPAATLPAAAGAPNGQRVVEPVTSGAVQGAERTSATYSTSDTASTTGTTSVVPVPPKADDAKEVYRTAYQQVKDRKFEQAKVSLVAFIDGYPDSRYVPNAHFWLGELFYLESELEKSRDAFLALVTGYASHRKAPDAKFKLGKIYHQLGDNDRARVMLESVITDHADSKAVNPAREYLKNSLR